MATLAEQARTLKAKQEEQLARYQKLKSDDFTAEAKSSIRAELAKAEPELKTLSEALTDAQGLAEQERRIQHDIDRMSEGKSSVPFEAGDVLNHELKTAGEKQFDGRTIGQMIADSPAMKTYMETRQLGGGSANLKQNIACEFGEFKSILEACSPQDRASAMNEMSRKASTFTSSGLTTNIEMIPGTFVLGTQPLRVANLFPQMMTESPVIRYLRENSFTNDAAWRLEGAAIAQTGSDIVPVNANVMNLGVFEKVTEENLLDYPFISSYLNARLPLKVMLKEDSDIINGASGGSSITGILNVSGVLQHAAGYDVDETTAVADDTAIESILRGMARVNYQSFFAPNAIVVNPFDWMNIRMTRVGTGDAAGGATRGLYQFGQPSAPGLETLWGMQVVQTTFCPRGTAIVGAWQIAGAVARRQGLVTDITNSDGTDFENRVVAIRVTERIALPIFQPQALCVVTLGSIAGS